MSGDKMTAGSISGNVVVATTANTAFQPLITTLKRDEKRVSELTEENWNRIGSLCRTMDEWDRGILAFESALRQNPNSKITLRSLAKMLIERDQFAPALELFQRLLNILQEDESGDNRGSGNNASLEEEAEVMADIAICWLGIDDLGKASIQLQKSIDLDATSLSHGGNDGHSSNWWYALAIYHDRIGNEEAAIDAYLAFIEREDTVSDRTREVYYRLGVLYRLTGKMKEARDCFEFVRRQLLVSFSRPGWHMQITGPSMIEVSMQLALVDEAEGDSRKARGSLEKLLIETSSNSYIQLSRLRNLTPKIRQKLGCLALSLPTVFENDSSALGQLLKATEEDPHDALNWYFLGRLYFQLRQPTKAYDAYQQAVFRDGRNAAFWNSIGILYYYIGQFRDALDAYTRAVHHATNFPAIWWNLGLLYEACNGQIEDAKEAYGKALEFALARSDSNLIVKIDNRMSLFGRSGPNPTDFPIELDANRFVIRVMLAFPRPQSAATISRFLTRGQQIAQQQQQQQHQLQQRRSIPFQSNSNPIIHSGRPIYGNFSQYAQHPPQGNQQTSSGILLPTPPAQRGRPPLHYNNRQQH